MKLIKLGGLLAGIGFLAACVTINIYFPAAQAEQAAEKIVDDILGTEPAADDKGASLEWQRPEGFALRAMDFFVPSAQAAAPDFNVNTPRIRKIQAAMKQRNAGLKKHYDSGAIGFTRDALVAIRDAKAISLKDKKKVNALVRDENADRNALYRAIADANGHPEWEPDVRATFARTWVQKAKRGWWYQDEKGGWRSK